MFGISGVRKPLRVPYRAILQRLFTTFANSWPGFALLVQRLAIGICLLHSAFTSLGETTAAALLVSEISAAALGVLVMAGLWTPVSGTLVAILELVVIALQDRGTWMPLLLAVFSLSLAMIGPGSWSIDARLFGRKRIGN